MTDPDPYAVLGVPRTASRAEIARAYRALARRHHPDAGAAPSPTMARINEAWQVLRDAERRASWDRRHTVVEPPPWVAPGMPVSRPAERARRPVAEPAPAPMERPQRVAAVALGVLAVLAAVLAAVALITRQPEPPVTFASAGLRFDHPADWTVVAGAPAQDAGTRVIAHAVTFPVGDDELCTDVTETCQLTGDGLPGQGASVLITAHEGGPPRIADPDDLDAGEIGGAPAAYRVERVGRPHASVWWQLSPPGFPDRWIEVRADVAGLQREREALLDEITAMLDSLEFTDTAP